MFKSFATKLLFGSSLIATSLLTFGVQPSKADFAPNNDQIWAFELANGQRANLPSSQRSTSGRFYSWPADSSGDQNFVLSSDGNGWNIRHTPSGFMMTSPTTTPNSNGATQLVPQSGGYNTAQTFDFVDTGAGNNTFNIKFRANPAYCVNVPFGQQNKILNLWPCSNTDPTQVFKGVYLGGNPTYVAPMTNGSTGYLESANGYRISMPAIGANAQLPVVSPNDSDPYQKFTFSTNGSAYMFTRTGTASGISSNDLNFIGLNGGSMGAVAYPNTGGRYAGFNFVSLGSGWYQIKHFFYPQYCLNAAPPVANIVPCNSNASSQRFRMSGGGAVTQQYEVVNDTYGVVLNSIRPANWLGLSQPQILQSDESGTFGHSWITLEKKYDVDTVSYQNGQVVGRVRFSSGLVTYTTISASGLGLPLPEYDNSFHRKLAEWFITNRPARVEKTPGEVGTRLPGATVLSGNRLISYLPAAISKNAYLKYMPISAGGQGMSAGSCNTYSLIPDNNPNSCSCGVFATQIFHDTANTSLITGIEFIGVQTPIRNPFNNTVFYIPTGINVVTPTGISREIDKQNGLTDWNR